MNTINKIYSVLFAMLIAITLQAQETNFIPGQMLIKLKSDTKSQKNSLKSQLEAKTLKEYPNLNIELWELKQANGKQATLTLIEQYKNHPDVEFAEPNYLWEAVGGTEPNDRYFPLLWGLHNTGQNEGTEDADIDAPEAYCMPISANDVVVGIIDTGVDYTHEDLAENIWQNLGEDANGNGKVLIKSGNTWIFDPGDENGIDDDGNGYIDDFVGWNFAYDNNKPMDLYSHGTHCAGTIGATTNNNIGINGVAPNAKLAALKFLGDDGSGNTSDAVDALNYAVAMDMPITNNSWGGGAFSETLYQALQNAEANNHLFIAAAGNNNLDNDQHPHYPSSYDNANIISVASTDRNDNRSSFSNYGLISVDIGAPGSQIYSCIPGNGYNNKNGTSMATPHVAGVCAFMLGANPGSTYSTIKNTLINADNNLSALNGKCVSGGRLNLHDALVEMGAPANPCDDEACDNPPCNPPITCDPQRDRNALIALYNATDGANWTNTWDLNQPMDTWYGLHLNGEGCVTCIDLDGDPNCDSSGITGNNLNGTIPAEIGDLKSLTQLRLGDNELSGNIPPELGELTNLIDLEIKRNDLTGNIPPELGELINLTDLILGANDLTGIIPPELGKLHLLEYLTLSYNDLSGNIPPELKNLINLNTLHLHSNDLTGSIPTELKNLINLTSLQLNDNLLSGIIPAELGQLIELQRLTLEKNTLSGSIPPTFSNLKKLGMFNVNDNNLSGCYDSQLHELLCIILPASDFFNGNEDISDDNNFDATWEEFCATGAGECPPVACDDRQTLIEIYNALGGPASDLNWDLTQPMNTWQGVIVNEFECVTELRFNNENLNGTIPSSIGNLKNLQILDLSFNNIEGEIPTDIGDLRELKRLVLRDNLLTGVIPPEIGNLVNLEILIIQANMLTGEIPVEIGNLTKLTWLQPSYNQLSGEIPASIGNLVQLTNIFIEGNLLTGGIPTELCNLSKLEVIRAPHTLSGCFPECLIMFCDIETVSLGNGFDATWEDFCATGAGECSPIICDDRQTLIEIYNTLGGPASDLNWDLTQTIDTWEGVSVNENGCITKLSFYGKNLTGTISRSIGNLEYLKIVNFSTNNIFGEIPAEIGNLEELEVLSLSRNDLTGSIPPEIGNLVKLYSFSLRENTLTGEIPVEIGNLVELENLSLYNNLLTGEIPAEIGNLTKLKQIKLYTNQLSGEIPPSIGNLVLLEELKLSYNELTGSIPGEIGNLTWLLNLSMRNNQLTGSIPPEIGNLRELELLILAHNMLTGEIPIEIGNLTKLGWLQINSNELSGEIPASIGNLVLLDFFDLGANQLSGNIPPELCNLTIENTMRLSGNQLSGCYPACLNKFCTTAYWVGFGDGLDATWSDFCATGAGSCSPIVSEVWPGDFDNNGVAEINDLLYWGISNGNNGVTRPNATINWNGQDCENWTGDVNGINYKYQDGDGNGIVNEEDLLALIQNFGETHSFSEPDNLVGSYQMKITPNGILNGANDGLAFEYLLEVSDNGNPINAHGICASVFFGNLKVAHAEADLSGSSLQAQEHIERYNEATNTYQICLTRNDGINQPVTNLARIIVQVNDEPDSGVSFALNVNSGSVMRSNGTLDKIAGATTVDTYYENGVNDSFITLSASTIPANCENNGSAIVNPSGGSGTYTYLWHTGETTQQITNLSSGIYSVTVTDDNGISNSIEVEVQGQFIPIYDENGDIIPCGTIPNYSDLVICPESTEVNICAPVSPPPSLKLEDFERVSGANLSGELFLEVETLTDVQQYFTSTTYVYNISGAGGEQQTCQTQYHLANQFLQAPEVTEPGFVCEEKLWSSIKIGPDKYNIYKDENGSVGKLLSVCNTPGLLTCSTADFEVDTDIPGIYNFWISSTFSFPDGSICESPMSTFNVEIKPKPIANLSQSNMTINVGAGIDLRDMVTENNTGYWTGENILFISTTSGDNIPYFSSNTERVYKLYYTVNNGFCERSYLLIVNVTNGLMNMSKTLDGLNEYKSELVELQVYQNDPFIMYPNPCSKQIYIETDKRIQSEHSFKTATILDLNGQVMLQNKFENQTTSFDVSGLKKGIYMVEICSDHYQSIQKLLID